MPHYAYSPLLDDYANHSLSPALEMGLLPLGKKPSPVSMNPLRHYHLLTCLVKGTLLRGPFCQCFLATTSPAAIFLDPVHERSLYSLNSPPLKWDG